MHSFKSHVGIGSRQHCLFGDCLIGFLTSSSGRSCKESNISSFTGTLGSVMGSGSWLSYFVLIFRILITKKSHYDDVKMGAMASQITSLTIVYSTVYSHRDQRKLQSSVSLAFVWGIHRGPVNSPHKWPVTRKSIPFDDVIMVKCVRQIF